MSGWGNIFEGVSQGVKDTLSVKEQPKKQITPKQNHIEENKKIGVTIFGMKPLTFGLVSVGIISTAVIITKVLNKGK